MASNTNKTATVSVPILQLDHWLVAVRAAVDVIMDVYPNLQEPLQPAEQLVVTAIHQLSLTENAILQVLGHEMGYVPACLVDSVR